MQLTPTIYLQGNCADAISFYRDALGAQVLSVLRIGDANPSSDPAVRDKIIRAALRVGDSLIYLSDGHHAAPLSFQGFSLAQRLPDREHAQRTLRALAEGGTIQLPLRKTTLAEVFGTVRDRFGVAWSVEAAAG